jgi:hypothetical protein
VNSDNQQVYMIHEFAFNITNIIGAHTLRSGLTYRDYLLNNYDLGSSSGSLTLDSTWTRGPLDTSAAAPIGQDMASFCMDSRPAAAFPSMTTMRRKKDTGHYMRNMIGK